MLSRHSAFFVPAISVKTIVPSHYYDFPTSAEDNDQRVGPAPILPTERRK